MIDLIGSGLRGRSLEVEGGACRGVVPAAAALVAAAALLMAGCGGSNEEGGDESAGSGSAGEATTLSADAFIDRADQICIFYETRIEAAGDDLLSELPPNGKPSRAQLSRFAREVVIPNLEMTIDGVSDLAAPVEDQAEIDRILAATSDAIGEIEDNPSILFDGDPPGLVEAGKLARRFGSRECGASDRAAYLQDS